MTAPRSIADLLSKHFSRQRRCECGRSLDRSTGHVLCATCRMRRPSSPSALDRELAAQRRAFDEATVTWAPATLRREAAEARREAKR